MSDIPPEIITIILLRLPVKSLLRFRCVSKPWRSLIDGQDFIKLHLHHSVESSSNQTLVVKSREPFFVDLDSFEQLDTGNIQSKPRCVAGSCNGLVLFQSESNDLILWNPSTRKQNKLPSTPLPRPLAKLLSFRLRHGQCALGYDSQHDDYKVVRTVEYFDVVQNSMRFCTETKIYSLKSNSWKKMEVPEDFPYVLLEKGTVCVYLNDTLHIVVKKRRSKCSSPGALILTFDLVREKYDELPKPGFSGVGDLFSVDVIGGCLAAVVFGGTKCSSEVWVMQEYGVKGSWFKLIIFDHLAPIEPWVNLRPLAYSKSGDEVLLHDNGLFFYWYDLRKKTVRVATIEGLNESLSGTMHDPFNAWLCVGSLVSPYGPGGVGVEDMNA